MPDGGCEVWWADLGRLAPVGPGLLDDVELERLARLRKVADRQRFTVGATLLRRVVALHLGRDPRAVRVERGCATCGRPHGRPRVEGRQVSVSHSGDRVVVAVTRDAPVGVDVEQVVHLDVGEFRAAVLAADDQAVADAAGLLRVWTRKEAVLKATGDGLDVPMTALTVGDGPRLLRYGGKPGLVMTLRDLAVGPGYAAALAVRASETQVRELDATALLSADPDGPAPG